MAEDFSPSTTSGAEGSAPAASTTSSAPASQSADSSTAPGTAASAPASDALAVESPAAATPEATTEANSAATALANAAPSTEATAAAPAISPEILALLPAEAQAAIQQLTASYETLRAQADVPAALPPEIEAIGGLEAAQQAAALQQALFQPDKGSFLETFYHASHEEYQGLVNEVIRQEAGYILQTLGLDPQRIDAYRSLAEDFTPTPQPGSVTSEELASIPQHLHETYKGLSQERRDSLGLQSDAERNEFLEDKKVVQDLQRARQEETARIAAEKQQSLRQAQVQRVNSFYADQIKNFTQSVAAVYTPFGPEAAADNQKIHRQITNEVIAQLDQNPQTAKWMSEVEAHLQQAESYKARNEKYKADQAERLANGLVLKLNAEAKKIMAEELKWNTARFGAHRGAQDQERLSSQPRTEIPAGNPQGETRRPSAVDRDGKITDDFKARLRETVAQSMANQA